MSNKLSTQELIESLKYWTEYTPTHYAASMLKYGKLNEIKSALQQHIDLLTTLIPVNPIIQGEIKSEITMIQQHLDL